MTNGQHIDLQRAALIVTTAVAVVSDAVLIPFYPQLFASRFGVEDATHIGVYLAATCLTVMFTLPLWAELERRIPTLALLVGAQLAAGLLAIACFFTTDVTEFWIVSLTMIVFKASYLLVYPYLMRLTDETNHMPTIGLLTVIVHLGAILGAVLGGAILAGWSPQHAFLAMAVGDFVQMGVCGFLLFKGAKGPALESDSGAFWRSLANGRWVQIARLAGVMFVLYFSAFTLRPFFVEYWLMRSGVQDERIAGVVFSIPAWMSLACLMYQRRNPQEPPVLRSIGLCTVGLALQCTPSVVLIVLGLAIFGWGLFRTMVFFDALIFETTSPELYATAFSQMHFFQQLGALVGFYAAGTAVTSSDLASPFFVAMVGFAITAALYFRFFLSRPLVDEIATAS